MCSMVGIITAVVLIVTRDRGTVPDETTPQALVTQATVRG